MAVVNHVLGVEFERFPAEDRLGSDVDLRAR